MVVAGSTVARLYLLGRVRLETADRREITPRSAKARGLLAYVALSPAGTAPRAKLASLLWGESMTAMASLRQAVKEIRNATAGLEVFAADHHSLRLDLERVWVDVLAFEDLVEQAADVAQIQAACARGLLEDETIRAAGFEDWLVVEQTRCRQHLAHVLENRLARALGRAARDLAVGYAEALLVLDPVHEQAHRALMRCHADAGDVAGAIRRYEVCRTVLARELDLAPSIETESLLQEIRGLAGKLEPGRRPALGPAPTERPKGYASLAVEYHVAPTNDPVDQTLGMALAGRLREALSRVRWLSVRDHDALIMPETRQEPADYDVRIGLLRGGRRVRMLVELRSVELQKILWAEHSDRPLGDDLFELADALAVALAGQIDREVQLAEITRVQRRPVETLSPYDHILKAIPLIFRMAPDSFAEAERLLLQAEKDDPHEPMVYAWRAFLAFLQIGQGWAPDVRSAKSEIAWLVRRAIELDPKNPFALAIAGHVASFVHHDYEQGLDYFERSLRLDPNSLYALDLSSTTQCYTGNAEEALRQLSRYREVWRYDPYRYFFLATACIAHMFAGQYDLAVQFGRRTIRENPNFQAAYRPLIASLGHIGQVEEAQTHLATLQRAEPDVSIDWFRAHYPPLQAGDSERYLEGLRKAGVPEG